MLRSSDTQQSNSVPPPLPAATANLSALLTAEGVYTHLVGLQRAADAGNASRRTDTAGYNASLAYVQSVVSELVDADMDDAAVGAGCDARHQHNGHHGDGDPTATITVGAHLDAVYTGMNDNGSGSSRIVGAGRGGRCRLSARVR